MTRRVLLTGADGQLGRSLATTLPDAIELLPLGIEDLDITNRTAVEQACRGFHPDVIINAAAYTAVDRAEEEADAAWAVNSGGVENLAREASSNRARLVQVSTDFVFDGRQSHPYLPTDPTAPLSVYGASKLGGEDAVGREPNLDWLILRTAWVYAAGGQNFVNTMLRLMRQGKDLRVVADQVGSPTWATSLARAIWRAVSRDATGLHHWTDAGVASWYDLAVAVQEEGLTLGLIDVPVTITPIRTEDYPVLAQRPRYSVLDKTDTCRTLDLAPPHWRENLRAMLAEVDPLTL